jgi:uncharacterized protein (TIGR02757 family)
MPEASANFMNGSKSALRDFLEEKSAFYNHPAFIPDDPIVIPHQFSQKEDIEITGFLTAMISWGNRKAILKSANRLLQLMDNAPFEFISNAKESDFRRFSTFVHRTFNGLDCVFFMQSLSNIYKKHKGLEVQFAMPMKQGETVKMSIAQFRKTFFELPHLKRTEKHIANPLANASAKRINMFLRWMVRRDGRSFDFGIWNSIKPADLYCPLDIHTGNVARKLGLLPRKANDWKSVELLTNNLRELDPVDPVKYDFALFGLGAYEKFA